MNKERVETGTLTHGWWESQSNDAAALKSSVAVPQKVKHRVIA